MQNNIHKNQKFMIQLEDTPVKWQQKFIQHSQNILFFYYSTFIIYDAFSFCQTSAVPLKMITEGYKNKLNKIKMCEPFKIYFSRTHRMSKNSVSVAAINFFFSLSYK